MSDRAPPKGADATSRPQKLATPAPRGGAPTMLRERVELSGVEVLERTTVHIVPRAHGTAPAPVPAPVLSLMVLPAALEREVFELARRVAMQADLATAVHVLRQGLSRLTDSPEAMCVFYDPTESEAGAEAPASVLDQAHKLVGHVATTGERLLLPNAIIEALGPAPAKAVLVLRRVAPAPAYGPQEVAVVSQLAAGVAGIMGHFKADHDAKKAQAARDAKTPFRPEALAERRRAVAAPGRVVGVPRTWVRWAFPTLIGLVVAVVAGAALVRVPTYSTGMAVVVIEGEQVTSPLQSTVAEVLVTANTHVTAGQPLVRMHAEQEEADAAALEADYRAALGTFLFNPGDDSTRAALAQIATRRQHATAALAIRTLKAPVDGVVGDIRVRAGQLVLPGVPVLKVSPEHAAPSIVALMPGFDRPRLQVGMTVQIDLPGYRKKREEAIIESIGTESVGPDEARRAVGDSVGEALPIGGPVVVVRARLSWSAMKASKSSRPSLVK